MVKLDNAKAKEILRDALAATGASQITTAHASDYGALGPLFVEVLRIMFPGARITMQDNGAALMLELEGSDVPALSLGLTSTMDRLNPLNLELSQKVIEEKIENTPAVVEEVLMPFLKGDERVSPTDRDLVVPLVMSSESFTNAENHSGGRTDAGDSPLVGWRLFDGVVGMASFDRGHTFHHVFTSVLPDLGMNRDEVRILAMRNLKKLFAKENYEFDYRERIFEVRGMNGLASSLLLLDDFWTKQRRKLGDDLVIHLVNRESLAFFRRSDKEALYTVVMALFSGQVSNLVEGVLFEFDGKMRRFWPKGMPKPN
ncbi:hypothetical protein O9X98_13470 [Agrobacterium salinitolerans]|nr:hypothetical protein [Agrobacterium salinitolerans]